MSSSTVASPPRAREAKPASPPPPVRHGTCRWSVWIATAGKPGGSRYSVRPLPDPPGFRGVFQLRKHGTQTTYTVAQPKSGDPGCTCPDHESRGACCKHTLALAALGLVSRPKAARPKKAPSQARALRSHAKHARAAIAEAKAMLAQAPPVRGTASRAASIGLPRADRLETDLMLSAATAPPGGSFADGFRQAVATHLKLKRGELIECELCRYPFDPTAEGTTHPALCGPCAEGGLS